MNLPNTTFMLTIHAYLVIIYRYYYFIYIYTYTAPPAAADS